MKGQEVFAAFSILNSNSRINHIGTISAAMNDGEYSPVDAGQDASEAPRDHGVSPDDLNPQGGSPANTLTSSQLDELRMALPGAVAVDSSVSRRKNSDIVDILDSTWAQPDQTNRRNHEPAPSWYGAPRMDSADNAGPRSFREKVRQGQFAGPTNGVCPGFLQCNLVVLPRGQHAFDFLSFCQVRIFLAASDRRVHLRLSGKFTEG